MDDYDDCLMDDFDDYLSSGYDDNLMSDDDDNIDGVGFADPGGRSALRRETKSNPRNRPCPTCGEENVLTPADERAGYQCDRCADRDERGY